MGSPTLDSTSITLDSTSVTLDQVATAGTWNIVFSAALQAPIVLSNPTGSLSVASDPTIINAKVSPTPLQGNVSLVGAAVKMALAMATNTGAMAVSGVGAVVTPRTVTTRQPTTGAITASGVAPSLAVGSATVLAFPRVMLVGIGGDQSYGRASGYPWTTAAAGTSANNFVQQVGAYDIAILSGAFEGWDSNGTYDRENLTQALGKSATTYAITKNNTRATQVFYYSIMNVTVAGNPYAQWQTLVNANNWFLYPQPAGGGTATSFINYSAAWPTAIGNAGIGASICGSNYGTTSSGSPTGAQGPARTFGNYASIKLLMRAYAGDSRFSFNAQMGSPSAAGIFLDECFVALDGDASTGSASLDGVTIAPGTQQGGGFPGLDTVQPVMARGNHNMFDQMQTMLALVNPGKTYYNFANFGMYANKYQFGTATLTCGLESTLHGGLIENVIGAGASSWECYQVGNPNTGNTTYPSGALNALANYYQGMDFCQSPKLVGVGTKLPASDGSQTASWVVGSGTTLTTVTAGTALEYQLMRCSLCMTLMDDGYWAPGCTGYDWSKVRWYDELGDDSLTQVNVKRGYLGTPLTPRPTTPFWSQGPLGVWWRTFTGGAVVWNPRGNGAQTVALPSTYQKLTGTQQPTINNGATVSSVSLADGDGLILLGPTWQLLPTHSVASPLAFTLIAPRTGMASIRYQKAYPGLLYRVPVVAVGGKYPYQYALSGQPTGMTVGQHYGDADYGVINWTNPVAGSYSYTVTVTDQAGATLSTTVSLTVTTTGFIFFDAVNGHPSTFNNGTGDGSIGNPFKDLNDWWWGAAGASGTQSTRKADTRFKDFICYYKNGTYTTASCQSTEGFGTGTISGFRVPMVTDNKPKVHLAYPGHAPVWDVTAAALQIYGDNGYGWWMHRITSAGVNNNSDQKFIAMDAGTTDTVLFENTFAPQSGTSGQNPTPFMITANRPNIAKYVSIIGNTYQGLSGAEAIELYDTQLCAVHNNTVSNSSEGNGGGFYFKEDCAGFSVRGNTALVGNTTCLVRYDNFFTELPNGATQAEICYNNALTTGMSVLFGLDGTSGGTEPNAGYGVVGIFRNTWRGKFCQISATNPHGTINVTGDVNIGDGTASNNWSVSGYLGTLNFDSTYLTGTSATGIVDSNGNLLGSYRTASLGIAGHEVA